MRILFIAADNSRDSGAFISMTALSRILNREHHIKTLVILPKAGTGIDLLNENNITYRLVRSFRWTLPKNKRRSLFLYAEIAYKKLFNFFATRKVMQIAREFEADLVHINATDSYIGAKAAEKLGIPCVWHIREFLEEDHQKVLWDTRKSRKYIGESARVITISNSLAEKYRPFCANDHLRMIHNGVDTELYFKPNKEIFANERIIFIYGGGYDYGKGLDELACAMAEINRSNNIDFEFWLLGACPDSYKSLFSDLGLSSRIKYVGYQKNVASWYERADISFNCSVSEAFGRKTVESMLAGNLVIASNTGGTVDIITHKQTGLLYKQGNPQDLKDAILYALNHPAEMKRIAENGRNYAYDHFSAKRNAADIVSIYNELLS